jgi:hypothetical protein
MASGVPKPQIDTSRPHSARVYDYLLGGKDNYLVDQELADSMPEFARDAARQNRAFMHRAVAWAAGEGIDQFLDIGTGIPTEPNLHQVAQGINPRARVVYADNDPIVLRHAEALLISTPEGSTDYLDADISDSASILERAGKVLDFARPVALSTLAVLHFVMDEQDPYGIVRAYLDALAPGSCLILTHASVDRFRGEADTAAQETYRSSIPLRLRGHAEIMRFFDGLEMVEPGLVQPTAWYRGTPAPEQRTAPGYVGVARVP